MSELIPSISITALLQHRALFEEQLLHLVEHIDKMEITASHLHAGQASDWMEDPTNRYSGALGQSNSGEDRKNFVRRRVDASVWSYLFNESGMRTFMDNKARSQWDDQIRKLDCPKLDYDTVCATFSQLYADRGDIFERGVIEVFKRLSWDYQTNCPMAFGKKIIMEFMVSHHKGWGFSNTYSDRTNQLDDLERMLYVLDEQPAPDHRQAATAKFREAVCDFKATGVTTLHTTMFDMKWYKKGTLHIDFLRLDLVDKLNGILAKYYPDSIAERS